MTHLCFAYDLMFFCRGDLKSVILLLRGLESFSLASGLQANRDKSAVYFGNVKEPTKQHILEVTGFMEEKLPFRYLGVPITTKELSVADCEILTEKISLRIKCWGSRNLSFTARVQLINSVLMSLYTYWASVFIIPQSVLKAITATCRNFLWAGREQTSKVSPIA